MSNGAMDKLVEDIRLSHLLCEATSRFCLKDSNNSLTINILQLPLSIINYKIPL